MNRAALAHCPLSEDPVCAFKRAQNPACRPPGPPLSHGRAGVRLWACGIHACEFTVFGERVSRPAVPVRVPHSGGGPAAGFMHAIRGHRPASRAGAAVSRTWLPAGRAVNCAQTGRAEVKNGVRLASSLCAHLRLNSLPAPCTHLAARRRGFALSAPRRPPGSRRTCIPVRRQEPRVTRFGVDVACRRRSFFPGPGNACIMLAHVRNFHSRYSSHG